MSDEPGHFEPDSVSFAPIAKIAGLLFGALPLALLLIGVFFRLELGRLPYSGTHRTSTQTFPAPQLEIDPRRDLADYRARQHRKLHAEAAVPIEKAIAVIVARGTNAYAPLKPPSPPPPVGKSP